jgi:hypothetical protein
MLVLFWIKIFAKCIVRLFKLSPVVVIGTAIILLAFIVGKQYARISLDNQKTILIIAVLFFASLPACARKYDTTHILTLYSKSNYSKIVIDTLFFVKQAVFNNIPLIVFNALALKNMIEISLFKYLAIATVASVLCSFLLIELFGNFSFQTTTLKNSTFRSPKGEKLQDLRGNQRGCRTSPIPTNKH